jgi:hypothetical protein
LLNECDKVKSGSGVLKDGELSLNVITEFNRGQNTTKTIFCTVAVKKPIVQDIVKSIAKAFISRRLRRDRKRP